MNKLLFICKMAQNSQQISRLSFASASLYAFTCVFLRKFTLKQNFHIKLFQRLRILINNWILNTEDTFRIQSFIQSVTTGQMDSKIDTRGWQNVVSKMDQFLCAWLCLLNHERTIIQSNDYHFIFHSIK